MITTRVSDNYCEGCSVVTINVHDQNFTVFFACEDTFAYPCLYLRKNRPSPHTHGSIIRDRRACHRIRPCRPHLHLTMHNLPHGSNNRHSAHGASLEPGTTCRTNRVEVVPTRRIHRHHMGVLQQAPCATVRCQPRQ